MNNLRLLNKYEEITYKKLKNVCCPDSRVFAKVRLADIFPISGSGISKEAYNYSLKAHFDLLVTDKDFSPQFSVEYDGKWHYTNQKQKRNDEFKNRLCDYFNHSLLRINSNYINNKYKGIDLLTYFIEAWYLEKAFYKAQEQGSVPYDESFDPKMIISNGNKMWPYWISSDLQLKIHKLYEKGIISSSAPSYWIGIDNNKNYRCVCWLEVKDNEIIRIKTGMRKQRFSAVIPSELLSMIAVFDLYKELKYYLDRKIKSVDISAFKKELGLFCSKMKVASSLMSGKFVGIKLNNGY